MSFKSLRYIKGVLFRMIKNLGASPDQAAPALTFCIPANYSSKDDKGAKWSCTINRKEGNYVVAGAAANGLAYLPVKQGNAFELHRLQHHTSPATKPSVSLVVDVCGTSLVDATTYTEDAFESKPFADADPPSLDKDLTPPLTKRFGFANQKDPEQERREAEEEAAFEAKMSAGRQLHEEGHLAKDALAVAGLLEQLEQPAAEKAKEAEVFTCKSCPREYTDATDSGGTSKRNYGYCSSKCRAAPPKGMCEHGRRKRKRQCKDCGTGRCKHGRDRYKCKDCGTGKCQHKLWKNRCKDCANRQ
jgi:hypothetical protein